MADFSLPIPFGTMGALVGLVLSVVMSRWAARKQLLGALFLVVIAVPICGYWAQAFPGHDDPRIVADELLTFPVATLGLPIRRHPAALAGVFVTSRILDGIKPFPASAAASLQGGLGIVLDDVVTNAWTLLLAAVGWCWYRRRSEARSGPSDRV
jgi:phosphatidylglycerophosphatase A